jgi:5'-methylthioadenosine phosphorylase
MEAAIITGTGIYEIPGFSFEQRTIETRYGPALVNIGEQDGFELAFLSRHGLTHNIPPHQINYRANIAALRKLGVRRILATNAVGSISREVPPTGLAVLSDFIDFTHGRAMTFYDGGRSGLVHTDMGAAYCPALSRRILDLAPQFDLHLRPTAVYVATNGPRFETPAEIRMYGMMGADVVGMTGVPEVILARELDMHYASVAYSINWAAGVSDTMEFVSGSMAEIRQRLVSLLVRTLQEPARLDCSCERALMVMHPPEDPLD